MGYYSDVWGQLVVEPALRPTALGDFAKDDPDIYEDLIAKTVGDEPTLAFDENNKVIVVPGTAHTVAECRFEESYKAYDLEANVKKFVDLVKDHSAVCNGAIYVQGEEPDDRWRIRVENNVLHVERPQLVWPNGETQNMGR